MSKKKTPSKSKGDEPVVNYLIRGVPEATWRKVKSRAALEGVTVNTAIQNLLSAYATERKHEHS